jgi:hypothetical protein
MKRHAPETRHGAQQRIPLQHAGRDERGHAQRLHGDNRVNVKRTLQLIDTGASTVASACPFCMTMLSDGLKAKDREDIRQLDVVELLAESCGAGEANTPAAAE